MSDTYTCADCHMTFRKGWSDEEAKAEAAEVFPDVPLEGYAVVCDDCYKKMATYFGWLS